MAVRLNVVHSPAASPPAVPGVQGLPSVYFLHPSPTTLSKPSKPSPNEGRHRDHKCDNKPFYHPPGHLSLLNDRLFSPPRYIGLNWSLPYERGSDTKWPVSPKITPVLRYL